ncbi:hypothetical protein ACFQX7_00005 [Luedemannella flava]
MGRVMAARNHRPGIVTITVLGAPAAVQAALREVSAVLDVEQVGHPVTPHKGSRLVSVRVAAHVLIDPDALVQFIPPTDTEVS